MTSCLPSPHPAPSVCVDADAKLQHAPSATAENNEWVQAMTAALTSRQADSSATACSRATTARSAMCPKRVGSPSRPRRGPRRPSQPCHRTRHTTTRTFHLRVIQRRSEGSATIRTSPPSPSCCPRSRRSPWAGRRVCTVCTACTARTRCSRCRRCLLADPSPRSRPCLLLRRIAAARTTRGPAPGTAPTGPGRARTYPLPAAALTDTARPLPTAATSTLPSSSRCHLSVTKSAHRHQRKRGLAEPPTAQTRVRTGARRRHRPHRPMETCSCRKAARRASAVSHTKVLERSTAVSDDLSYPLSRRLTDNRPRPVLRHKPLRPPPGC